MTCPEPPDPPSRPIHGPADEIDLALDDADTPDLPEPGPTVPDDAEYLGSYSTIAAYLRAMLEPEVTPACAWILAHLDYAAIQRRWESDGSRLVLARGHVSRVTTSRSAHT